MREFRYVSGRYCVPLQLISTEGGVGVKPIAGHGAYDNRRNTTEGAIDVLPRMSPAVSCKTDTALCVRSVALTRGSQTIYRHTKVSGGYTSHGCPDLSRASIAAERMGLPKHHAGCKITPALLLWALGDVR